MPDLNRSGVVVGYVVEIIGSAHDHRRSSSCFGCAPARSQDVAASAAPAPHPEVVHTLSLKHEPSTGGFVMAGVPAKRPHSHGSQPAKHGHGRAQPRNRDRSLMTSL